MKKILLGMILALGISNCFADDWATIYTNSNDKEISLVNLSSIEKTVNGYSYWIALINVNVRIKWDTLIYREEMDCINKKVTTATGHALLRGKILFSDRRPVSSYIVPGSYGDTEYKIVYNSDINNKIIQNNLDLYSIYKIQPVLRQIFK